jgi:hypothetical protein
MWSGPRNISTALLRAFGNRPDTWVCDEPLYAFYLRETGLDHPGRDEVIASQENDWREVARELTGPVPHGRAVWYQKHMAHHLLPAIDDRRWLDALTNCFLIREPREMLTSLLKILPEPRLPDTAFPQQAEMFEDIVARTGTTPPVIDARDVLENPRGMLEALCDAVGIPFTEAMLSWPPGPRATDGVWAKHWYGEVEKSTGFHRYRPKRETVPAELAGVLRECERLYEKLHARRLIA